MLVGIGFLPMKAHIATDAAFALSQFLIANYFELKLINVIVSMVTLVNLTIDGARRPGKDHPIGNSIIGSSPPCRLRSRQIPSRSNVKKPLVD